MTQQQQDAIDSIMDYFKFEQVRQVMELLNWEWQDAEEGIPTVPELRKQARRLLKMSLKEKAMRQLILSFSFAHHDFVR